MSAGGQQMSYYIVQTQAVWQTKPAKTLWFEGHPRNRTSGLKNPQIAPGGDTAGLSVCVQRSQRGCYQQGPGEGMEKKEEAAVCHVRVKTVMAALPLAALTLATCTHRYFVGVDYLIHPPPPPSFHHVSLIVTVTIVN